MRAEPESLPQTGWSQLMENIQLRVRLQFMSSFRSPLSFIVPDLKHFPSENWLTGPQLPAKLASWAGEGRWGEEAVAFDVFLAALLKWLNFNKLPLLGPLDAVPSRYMEVGRVFLGYVVPTLPMAQDLWNSTEHSEETKMFSCRKHKDGTGVPVA